MVWCRGENGLGEAGRQGHEVLGLGNGLINKDLYLW